MNIFSKIAKCKPVTNSVGLDARLVQNAKTIYEKAKSTKYKKKINKDSCSSHGRIMRSSTWTFLIDMGESKEIFDKPDEIPYVGVVTFCRLCNFMNFMEMFIATYEHFYHRCKAPYEAILTKWLWFHRIFEPAHSNHDVNWTNALARIERPAYREWAHIQAWSQRDSFSIGLSHRSSQFESITINLTIDFDRTGQPSCFEAFNNRSPSLLICDINGRRLRSVTVFCECVLCIFPRSKEPTKNPTNSFV